MNTDGIRTIFFDYDGTLHDSMKIYAPAFRKAYENLVEMGLADEKRWSEDEISKWIGYNPKEMWKNFMPHLSQELRDRSSETIGAEMNRLIELGHPVLYKNALETLSYLKSKGYTLVFISNCRKSYMESHRKLFNLDDYFTSMICSEGYNYIPKEDILKIVLHSYPKEWAIVGDRGKDIDAGKKNGIMTIGCNYGFGSNEELQPSDIRINDIAELRDIF